MRRGLLVLLLAAITCGASPQDTNRTPSASFDPKPWLDDFHQVMSEMSSHYANLEWAIEDRRMDLPRLRVETEAKLHAAIDEHMLVEFSISLLPASETAIWKSNGQKAAHKPGLLLA